MLRYLMFTVCLVTTTQSMICSESDRKPSDARAKSWEKRKVELYKKMSAGNPPKNTLQLAVEHDDASFARYVLAHHSANLFNGVVSAAPRSTLMAQLLLHYKKEFAAYSLTEDCVVNNPELVLLYYRANNEVLNAGDKPIQHYINQYNSAHHDPKLFQQLLRNLVLIGAETKGYKRIINDYKSSERQRLAHYAARYNLQCEHLDTFQTAIEDAKKEVDDAQKKLDHDHALPPAARTAIEQLMATKSSDFPESWQMPRNDGSCCLVQ